MNMSFDAAGRRRRRIGRDILYFVLAVLVMSFVTAAAFMVVQRELRKIPSIAAQDASSSGEVSQADIPDGWELCIMPEDAIAMGSLVLVNGEAPLRFPDVYETVNIYEQKTNSYFVRNTQLYLDVKAMEPLNQILDAFYEQTGLHTINIVSGWRSVEEQQSIYGQTLEEEGLAYTEQYVARAGYSEHHTGLAVDLSIFHEEDGTSEEFRGQGEYAWFAENAWKYGFIQRYGEDKQSLTGIADEPWHFRYVGLPHAMIMTQNDLCLEEYLAYVKDYTYDGELLQVQYDGVTYEIYYCPADAVVIPDASGVTISGNNVDGYIVTVSRG